MSWAATRPVAHGPASVGKVVYSPDTISRRLDQLARQIDRDWEGQELSAVGVLNSALPFMSDLLRRLRTPVTTDFVSLSRYRGLRGERCARLVKDVQDDIAGRHVLLIDDLVDTGLSAHFLCRLLQGRGPASVTVCALLSRPELLLVDIPLRYVGFHVSQEFLVGYGLDYQGLYRELPYIATLQTE